MHKAVQNMKNYNNESDCNIAQIFIFYSVECYNSIVIPIKSLLNSDVIVTKVFMIHLHFLNFVASKTLTVQFDKDPQDIQVV